ATAEQRLATMFNRQTLTNEEGGVDQEEFRVNAVFDRTETIGSIYLGLTVGCARCLAHEYYPLQPSHSYRLLHFFNDAYEILVDYVTSGQDLLELDRRLQPLQAALDARHRALADAELAWSIAEHQRLKATTDQPLAEQTLSIEQARFVQSPELKSDTPVAFHL